MKKILLTLLFVILFSLPAFSQELYLESIGALGGQNLYLTYTSLGTLSDGFQSRFYDANFTMKLTKDIQSSLKKSRGYFERLLNVNTISDNDKKLIKNILEAYESLLSEANALISLIENNNNETLQQFQKFKARSWNRIQDVLSPGE